MTLSGQSKYHRNGDKINTNNTWHCQDNQNIIVGDKINTNISMILSGQSKCHRNGD